MFNVFGQVQQDGSITIQKMCEDCESPGDEDGFEDCEDLDCLLKSLEGFKQSAPQKLMDECPINDLNTEETIILLELKEEFIDLGFSAEEALIATRFEYWQREGLIFPEPQECDTGNDIFDLNGDFIRRDESSTSNILIQDENGNLINVNDPDLELSADAIEKVAKYYVSQYFPNTPAVQNVKFLATFQSGPMQVSNTANERECTNSRMGDPSRNIQCCTYEIGLRIGTNGSLPSSMQGIFYQNRHAFLSDLSHEMNHLFAQYNLENGCANFTDNMLAMQHVIIYHNQINSGFYRCAFEDGLENYMEDYQERLQNSFIAFLNTTKTDPAFKRLQTWAYCTVLKDLATPELIQTLLESKYKYVLECD